MDLIISKVEGNQVWESHAEILVSSNGVLYKTIALLLSEKRFRIPCEGSLSITIRDSFFISGIKVDVRLIPEFTAFWVPLFEDPDHELQELPCLELASN